MTLRDPGPGVRPQAHAEHVTGLPAWPGECSEVTVEAGAKRRAVFRVRDEHPTTPQQGHS